MSPLRHRHATGGRVSYDSRPGSFQEPGRLPIRETSDLPRIRSGRRGRRPPGPLKGSANHPIRLTLEPKTTMAHSGHELRRTRTHLGTFWLKLRIDRCVARFYRRSSVKPFSRSRLADRRREPPFSCPLHGSVAGRAAAPTYRTFMQEDVRRRGKFRHLPHDDALNNRLSPAQAAALASPRTAGTLGCDCGLVRHDPRGTMLGPRVARVRSGLAGSKLLIESGRTARPVQKGGGGYGIGVARTRAARLSSVAGTRAGMATRVRARTALRGDPAT